MVKNFLKRIHLCFQQWERDHSTDIKKTIDLMTEVKAYCTGPNVHEIKMVAQRSLWHFDCNLEMQFKKLKGDIDAQVIKLSKQLVLFSEQVKIYDILKK